MGAVLFLEQIKFLVMRIGQIFDEALLNSALLLSGLIEDLIERLSAAMTAAAGLSVYDGGFGLTGSWMDGLIDGINSRLGELEGLLAYIFGLFQPPVAGRSAALGTSLSGRSMVAAPAGNVNISFTGPISVRNDRDINALANEIGLILARQASVQHRSAFRV